jgi:hypothetical protein
MSVPKVKEGLIMIKMETWHFADEVPVAGWETVNNERNLGTTATAIDKPRWLKREQIPFCDDFHFDFAIDGNITSWNLEKFMEAKKDIQRVVEVFTLLDDEAFVKEGEKKYVKGHVRAGFIGGYSKGLVRYTTIFYDNLKKRQHNEFIGREEPMLDEACLVEQNLCLLAAPGKMYERQLVYMAPFLILGQKEMESLVYVPTVATDKVLRDVVNSLNVIKPPNATRNVLMVVAHPDDEVLWGGEYLIKEGQHVHVVVTSTQNRDT